MFDDADAFVSPDGGTLFFTSNRPPPGGPTGGRDVWAYSLDEGPGERLRHLSATVSSPADEYSPVVTASGSLYFASTRDGGMGQGDLYVASPDGDGYGPARNLGPALNSPFGEWNLVVDPEERFLIFEGSGRALNRSQSGDLYVSFRDGEGGPRPPPWGESTRRAAISCRGCPPTDPPSTTRAPEPSAPTTRHSLVGFVRGIMEVDGLAWATIDPP